MKTYIAIMIFLMSLCISTSNAQSIRAYGIKVGYVKAEQRWNYTPQSGLDGSWIKPIWGLAAGAFVEFFNDPNFSLLTEVHYLQKGRSLSVVTTERADNGLGFIEAGQQEVKQRFEYISIPVLARLCIDGQTLVPFVAAGPSFEYLTSYPASPTYDRFNKTELALVFSAGVELSVGITPKLLAECRYNLGLTNTYKNEFVAVDNRVLEFLLGVAF